MPFCTEGYSGIQAAERLSEQLEPAHSRGQASAWNKLLLTEYTVGELCAYVLEHIMFTGMQEYECIFE